MEGLGLTGCSLQLLEIDEDEFQLDSVWVYEVEHRTDVQNIPNLRARDIMSVEPAGPPFQFREGLGSRGEMVEASALWIEPTASVVCVLE
jgi:hypothetical protein